MNTIKPVMPGTIQLPENAKTERASQDFEAVLLDSVFGDLQATFTNLPGKTLSNSSKAYNGIAMQALAAGLSRGGGIGLGAFVNRWLESGIRHQASGG